MFHYCVDVCSFTSASSLCFNPSSPSRTDLFYRRLCGTLTFLPPFLQTLDRLSLSQARNLLFGWHSRRLELPPRGLSANLPRFWCPSAHRLSAFHKLRAQHQTKLHRLLSRLSGVKLSRQIMRRIRFEKNRAQLPPHIESDLPVLPSPVASSYRAHHYFFAPVRIFARSVPREFKFTPSFEYVSAAMVVQFGHLCIL